MATNKKIQTTELDFDEIATNIKTYLSGQEVFKDYNFEGSALSTLISVLAYNTHYAGLTTNFAVNEMFMDSVSKYSSAVSLAKMMGYTAKSVRASRVRIDLVVTDPGLVPVPILTIPTGTRFSTSINGVLYYFNTRIDVSAELVLGSYYFTNIELIEGEQRTVTIPVTPTSYYVIPSLRADMTSLSVRIQDGSEFTKYNLADGVLTITPTSKTFFIKQREDLYYEASFGDGIIGKALVPGNNVVMTYTDTNGPGANLGSAFTYSSGFRGDLFYDATLTVPGQNSSGGANPESLDSIKTNAPRTYITQNRAVTSSDYETLIRSINTNIETVRVWGGQDNVPPIFGKVFIAMKPFGGEVVSEAEKATILSSILDSRKVVTVSPVIVDPEYLRIQFNTRVFYDPLIAKWNSGQLQTIVRNSIIQYGTTLNTFDSQFRYSTLVGRIDAADFSITSNLSTIRVRKPVRVLFNSNANYTTIFNNPIKHNVGNTTFWSTRFFIETVVDRCYIKDNGRGIINVFSEDIKGVATFIRPVGTIDYGNGRINIPQLNISGLYDAELEFMFEPDVNDIVPRRQYIVTLPPDLTTINIIANKTSV
jgi:hypothetical protein